MNRLQTLFSFSKKISFKKVDLYKELELRSEIFKGEGFSFEPDSFFDLYCYDIIAKGINNKINVEKAYDIFIGQHFDFIEHCTYDQRRKMIQADLDKVLDVSTFFLFESHKIFIPYLEDFMNQRYCYDHAVVSLKQHMQYLNDYPKSINQMLKLYNDTVLLSDFSNLEYVGTYLDSIWFYNQYGILIGYDKNTQEYIEFCVVDKYNKVLPSKEQVNGLLELLGNNEELVGYMVEHSFIHQKYQKKLIKKLNKENLWTQ